MEDFPCFDEAVPLVFVFVLLEESFWLVLPVLSLLLLVGEDSAVSKGRKDFMAAAAAALMASFADDPPTLPRWVAFLVKDDKGARRRNEDLMVVFFFFFLLLFVFSKIPHSISLVCNLSSFVRRTERHNQLTLPISIHSFIALWVDVVTSPAHTTYSFVLLGQECIHDFPMTLESILQ